MAMSKNKLPHLPHIAKAIRPTIQETAKALHELDKGMPPWNYGKAVNMTSLLYSGELSLTAALKACDTIKHPQGVISNAEVIKAVWADSQKASYLCYPLKERLFYIRPDLAIPVRPRFYFVKNDVVHIFWLQPWKIFEMTEEQLGIVASVIKDTFVVDEFSEARLHMLDTSAPEKDSAREPQVFGFDDLPMLSYDQLKSAFDRFAAAYDIFSASRQAKAERPARTDERQGNLF